MWADNALQQTLCGGCSGNSLGAQRGELPAHNFSEASLRPPQHSGLHDHGGLVTARALNKWPQIQATHGLVEGPGGRDESGWQNA